MKRITLILGLVLVAVGLWPLVDQTAAWELSRIVPLATTKIIGFFMAVVGAALISASRILR